MGGLQSEGKYRLLLQYPQDKKGRFGNRRNKIRKIYNEKTAVIS